MDQFHKEVRNLLRSELKGLDSTAVLATKRLIKAGLNDSNDFDTVNLRESYGKHEVALGSDNKFLQLKRRDLQAEFHSLNSQELPKRRSGTNSDNCINRKQKNRVQLVTNGSHGRVLYYGRFLTS